MNTFGDKTQPTVILTHESHKLHKEFVAGAAIGRSQAVKLNSDGEVIPLETGDNRNLCIGVSIHFGAENDLVTVVMKPFLTLLCRASATIVPGPVNVTGYYTNPALKQKAAIGEKGPGWGCNIITQGTATGADGAHFGIALEGGAANGFIEVVVFC